MRRNLQFRMGDFLVPTSVFRMKTIDDSFVKYSTGKSASIVYQVWLCNFEILCMK
jgi:hypothetical protein